MLNNPYIFYSLLVFLVFIITYLIGSFPTGYVVVKLLANKDIRTIGSGSTGATNVKRVLGFKWFVAVLLIDAVKGIVPVLAAKLISFPVLGLLPVVAAVAVIIGHSKSVFLNFHGGKSVATGVGTIIALNWVVGLSVALIWACITYFSKYVSLGSIIAVWVAPCLMFILDKPVPYIFYCVIGALYITVLHRDNIVRLLHNEENKVR